MTKRKIIIDTDPGHDDAMAIILAGQHLDILGITTVAGNQTLEKVTTNALRIVEVMGMTHIPVMSGMDRPLIKEPRHAGHVHGESGMDGPSLSAPTTAVQPKHAVDFLIDTCMSQSDVTLVPIGPLTNIAAALRREPRIASRIVELSLMGGSATIGNSTPAAEFNIWFDPEAADIVFRSGVPIKMLGLNLTHQVIAGEAAHAKIRAIPTRAAQFIADLLTFYADKRRIKAGAGSGALHDPCAIACLIDPTLVEFYDMHVAVELRGAHTYGMTVCDMRHLRGAGYGFPQAAYDLRGEKPNVQVGMKIDAARFFKLFYDTLAMYT